MNENKRTGPARFPCTKCGYAYTRIAHSSSMRNGLPQDDMRRTRKCLSCDAGFVTYEITAAEYAQLKAIKTAGDGNVQNKKLSD